LRLQRLDRAAARRCILDADGPEEVVNLLDDARAMMGPISVHCYFCTGSEISGHFDGCPALTTLPRIVAALEAAERLLKAHPDYEPICEIGIDHVSVYEFCEGNPYISCHDSDCPWQALAAAMRGEEVVPSS
jgi:hypothetical protein